MYTLSTLTLVCALLNEEEGLLADKHFLNTIVDGYDTNPWVQPLIANQESVPGLSLCGQLWYIGDCLVIPTVNHLWETLFRVAHDVLGHFGFDKSYVALRSSYFWPNMCHDLEQAYIPACGECQRNKSSTIKPIGPLHLLPIPVMRLEIVSYHNLGSVTDVT